MCILETVDGLCVHDFCPKTLPGVATVDHSLAEEEFPSQGVERGLTSRIRSYHSITTFVILWSYTFLPLGDNTLVAFWETVQS